MEVIAPWRMDQWKLSGRIAMLDYLNVLGAAVVTVASAADTLTGLMDWVIPSALTLTSTVEIRMEQPATWTNTPGTPIGCP